MNTGLGTHISQNQHLALTPKMVEELKILQMSYIDLMQYIDVQLNENPLLEIKSDDLDDVLPEAEITDDDVLPEAEISQEDIDSHDYREQIQKKDFTEYTSSHLTLRQHLLNQLGELCICREIRRIAFYLIETISDDGYIGTSISDVSYILDVPVQEVKKAIKVVQKLEPTGIGARNLKECILLQFSQRWQLDDAIKTIVLDFLELLAEKKFKAISQKLGLSLEQIVDIHQKIKSIDPKPGLSFSDNTTTGYIHPELVIKLIDDKFIVLFSSDSTLDLKVSEYYKKLFKSKESSSETKKYIKSKITNAMEIINAIEQRRRTVLNVASCITLYQEGFLRKGHMFLRPLTLKMVADKVGLHESTISRTVNEKYIQTPQGVFELKFFFSSQIGTASDIGIAANAVKKAIRYIVQNEDKKSPLSDEQIRRNLEQDGILAARRTIAKYRQELNILPFNLR